MDVQHSARQPELVPGPPASAAVHEHRTGPVEGGDEGADAGEDDSACWQNAEKGMCFVSGLGGCRLMCCRRIEWAGEASMLRLQSLDAREDRMSGYTKQIKIEGK